MANTFQIKRGTDLSNAGTPAAGEPVWNSSTSKLYIGDGSTAASSLSQVGSEFLPLAGGTLTGALSGTTGSFSSTVTASGLTIGSAAITEAELEILDGASVTTAELNILDGVTSTASELNILDGVTSTAAELNILDGVTSTAAELNILDGVTSTATEINLLDGITTLSGSNTGDQTLPTDFVSKASGGTFTGVTKVATTTRPQFLVSYGGTTGLFIRDATSGGRGWQISTSEFTAHNIEFTPSTADDGTTFTTPAMVINGTTGRVGIGTNAPDTALHIKTTAVDNVLQIENSDNSGERFAEMQYHVYGTMRGSIRVGYSSATDNWHNAYGGTMHIFAASDHSAEKMRIDASGRVGIGVVPETWSSNQDALQIGDTGAVWHLTSGGIESTYIGNNVYYNSGWKAITTGPASKFQLKDDTMWFQNAVSADADATLSFYDRMCILADGIVGIGTTSPNFPLDVNGGIGLAQGEVISWHDGSASEAGSIYFDSSDNFHLRTTSNSTERFTILAAGKVGIGTTAPEGGLNVHGTYTIPSTGIGNSAIFASSSDGLVADKGGVIQFGGIYNSSNAITQWAGIAGLRDNATDGNYAGYMAFYTRAQGAAPVERMRINSGGNVGIGTTNPSSGAGWTPLLNIQHATDPAIIIKDTTTAQESSMGTAGAGLFIDVSGHATATNNKIYFRTGPTNSNFGTNTRMTIDSAGNVGIGTTSPRTTLNVRHDTAYPLGPAANQTLILHGQAATSKGGSIGFDYHDSANTNVPASIGYSIEDTGANTKGSLIFATRSGTTDAAPTTRMTIMSSGNVGIGTTTDLMSGVYTTSTKLSVYGTERSILELGSSKTGNGEPMGAIQFINNDNADATNFDADAKVIAIVQAETATSDSNAGDDSGGELWFYTKPEADTIAANMVIMSDGKVGIGRTDPSEKLHVQAGSVMVTSTAYGEGRLIMMGRTGHQYEWYIDDPSSTQMSLYNRGRGGYDLTFAGGDAHFYNSVQVDDGLSVGVDLTVTGKIDVNGSGLSTFKEVRIGSDSADAQLAVTSNTSGEPAVWIKAGGASDCMHFVAGNNSANYIIKAMDENSSNVVWSVKKRDDAETSENFDMVLKGNATFAGSVKIDHVQPNFYINESDQSTDNKLWGMSAEDGNLYFSAINDGLSASTNWLLVERTGTTIDGIYFQDLVGIGNTTDKVGTTGLVLGVNDQRIELICSTYLAGYGWQLENVDNTGGSHELNFNYRSNSTSWTNSLKLKNDASATFAGNVGIGTTSPDGKLHIMGTDTSHGISANADNLIIEDTANVGMTFASDNDMTIAFSDDNQNENCKIMYDNSEQTLEFWTDELRRLRIVQSGATLFEQNINLQGRKVISPRYASDDNAYRSNHGWNGIQFGNNADNWIVGGNSYVNGNLKFVVNNTTDMGSDNIGVGNGTLALTLDKDGDATFTGDVTAYSDIRLKENINTIDSALDKVVKMRGVTFDRIDSGRSGAGVLADELQPIAPELVHDGEYKSVSYGNLTSYLIEAIKELKQEVEVLRGTAS